MKWIFRNAAIAGMFLASISSCLSQSTYATSNAHWFVTAGAGEQTPSPDASVIKKH